MKDETVGGIFLVGGFGVIISYLFLYFTGVLSKLMKIFKKSPFLLRLWYISAILTIVSVLYIMFYYTFIERIKDNYRDLFIISLIGFLSFAMLWSLSVFLIDKYKLNVYFQSPVLFFVALSTIGLLFAGIETNKELLPILALSMIVLHHALYDFLLWPYIQNSGQ